MVSPKHPVTTYTENDLKDISCGILKIQYGGE